MFHEGMFHVFKEQQGAQPQWKRIHKQESEGERQSGPGQAAFCGLWLCSEC